TRPPPTPPLFPYTTLFRSTPDGKYAVVACNGYNAHELTAIELATQKITSVETAPQSWFGLAADEATSRLWWSGGGDAVIRSFARSEEHTSELQSRFDLVCR